MTKEELQNEGIIKEEKILYLKSALNGQQGNLTLTPKRIVLDAHKSAVHTGAGGLIGVAILEIFRKKIEKSKDIFNLEPSQIESVEQGKHGINKNVLLIKDKQNNTYKIIVKNYPEWEAKLKEFQGK